MVKLINSKINYGKVELDTAKPGENWAFVLDKAKPGKNQISVYLDIADIHGNGQCL